MLSDTHKYFTLGNHICSFTYVCTSIHILYEHLPAWIHVYICVYICKCLYMYAYMHLSIYISIYLSVYLLSFFLSFFLSFLRLLLQNKHKHFLISNVSLYCSIITTSHQQLTPKSLMPSSSCITVPHQLITFKSLLPSVVLHLLFISVSALSASPLLSDSSEILGLLIYYLNTISILITKAT